MWVVMVLAIGSGLTRMACHPLPDLHGFGGIDIDNEMLVCRLGNLCFNLAAAGIVRDVTLNIGLALEDLHPTFFCQGVEGVCLAVHLDCQHGRVSIPP